MADLTVVAVPPPTRAPRLGFAWLALTAALAVHGVDEYLHDFLADYNPVAARFRAALGIGFPPAFDYPAWIAILAVGIALLTLAAGFAFRGGRIVRALAGAFAAVMFANGLMHIVLSLTNGRPIPGVITAPLLLACAGWLGVEAVRARRAAAPVAAGRRTTVGDR